MSNSSFKNFIINHKNILAEGSWAFSGQIVTALIQLVGIRIVTEFLTADLLGEATMWLGIVVLIKSIFIQPFLNYQLRFYPEHQINKSLNSFNRITFYATLILFIAGSFIFVIVSFILFHFKVLKAEFLLLFILILYFFFDIIKSFFLNQLSAERKQRKIALWSIFESIAVYLIIYLILSNSPTVESYAASMTAGIMLGIILFKNYSRKNSGLDYEAKLGLKITLQKALSYSSPLIPIAILSWMINLSSRYFIGIIDTAYEAGLFVAAFSLSSRPFIMLSGVIGGFLRPILFQAYTQKNNQKADLIKKYWLLSISVFGTIMILILVFGSDSIANTLLAEGYRENSSTLFLFIGLGYFGLALFQVFENFLLAEKRTKYILYANIVGTSIFVILSFILVREFSSVGAAIAVSISFSVQAFTVFYLYKYK